jgi:hypothetical protein
MRQLRLAALSAALLLGMASVAPAQIVYVPGPAPVVVAAPQPIVPVVSYSYYPPAPVAYAPPPVTAYYAPAYAPVPTVAYYPPTVVAPAYGVYSQTTTYGFGIFRPRGVTTQVYYGPYVR